MRPLTNTYASLIGEHAARMAELIQALNQLATTAPNKLQGQVIAALVITLRANLQ